MEVDMKLRKEATNAVWVLVLGAITLFCFFALAGALDPSEVGWLTAVVGVLVVLAVVHFIHVRHTLDEHADGELARSVHAMRETRGF
jgi:uncharacterized membrane protein YhfC